MSTPASVLNLINSSGNNFHAQVARWFQTNGWHVQVSPYYLDQSQDKARELDLVVEKIWPIKDGFGQYEGDVVVRLFVECKFVGAETVFWFTPKNRSAAMGLVCRMGPFKENNLYTSKHHYLAKGERVAKLFATSGSKSSDGDPIFKALNQALNATLAMRYQPATHPALTGRGRGKLLTLTYPVVVCSSFERLYAADFFGDSEPVGLDENFQMEVEYAFADQAGHPRSELFLLDFVEFSKLQDFEDALAEGARAGAYLASVGW